MPVLQSSPREAGPPQTPAFHAHQDPALTTKVTSFLLQIPVVTPGYLFLAITQVMCDPSSSVAGSASEPCSSFSQRGSLTVMLLLDTCPLSHVVQTVLKLLGLWLLQEWGLRFIHLCVFSGTYASE